MWWIVGTSLSGDAQCGEQLTHNGELCGVHALLQVWLTVNNLVVEPKCRAKYVLDDFRKECLLSLKRFMNELLFDQMPVRAGAGPACTGCSLALEQGVDLLHSWGICSVHRALYCFVVLSVHLRNTAKIQRTTAPHHFDCT